MARHWPALESLLRWNGMRTLHKSRTVAEAPAPSSAPVVVTGQRAVGVKLDRNRRPAAPDEDDVVADEAGKLPGPGAPRADFSSLAMWKADVQLDQDGRARVAIPLPDSMTRWRIVALAMDGADMYGMGSATVQTRKDLQVLSSLPPVVRGGGELDQKITPCNDSDRAMMVRIRAQASVGTAAQLQRTVTLLALEVIAADVRAAAKRARKFARA